MVNDDIFRGVGVEVSLPTAEKFLLVKETLMRIGIASHKDRTLFPSCHILHKQQRYSIVHFKEMFILDNKFSTISPEDLSRRNIIAQLLDDWKLVTIVDKQFNRVDNLSNAISNVNLKIVSFADKPNWTILSKYNIGQKMKS